MPTPSTRTPVRIARGSYSNLNGSVSDLQDGEISYAEDQNKLYIKEGASLVALTYTPANPVFTGNATFDTNTLYVDGTNNRVGIQTATPRAILDLGTNADAATISNTPSDYQLGLNAAQSTTGDIGRNIGFIAAGAQKVTAAINSIDGGTNDTTSLAFWTGNGTAISEAMRIDNSGRVGIGVIPSASEGTELAIKSSDGQTNLSMIPGADTQSSQINFYNAAYNSTQGFIKYDNNDNSLTVRVNLNTALTIDSSRNSTFAGHLKVNDNKNIQLGSDTDAYLWHDGSNAYFRNTTGSFYIQSKSTENAIRVVPDAEVALFYNNVQTFETLQNGVKIIGSEGNYAYLHIWEDEGDDNADKWRMEVAQGSFKLANYSTGSWVNGLTLNGSNNATFAGSVSATSFAGDGSALTGIDAGGDPVCKHVYHSSSNASWNLTVPSGVTTMRVYAVGHGGNGAQPSGGGYYCTSGAGGGFAYGDITVVAGQTISFAVASKVATCTYGGTTMLTANPGADAVVNSQSNAAGGTATKHSSVANGGTYSGGLGGYMNATSGPGGGGAGSPLGNGCKAAKNGAGGIGCNGTWTSYSGGGAGSSSTGGGTDYVSGGSAPNQKARDGVIYPQFTDPLIKLCLNAGQVSFGTYSINLYYAYESYADTGVGGIYDNRGSGTRSHGNGGAFAGGGGGSQVTGGSSVFGGHGGLLCGGGGTGGSTGTYTSGNGGYGGGGGGTRTQGGNGTPGTGGHAAIFVFYK